jgi:hypothetical protein
MANLSGRATFYQDGHRSIQQMQSQFQVTILTSWPSPKYWIMKSFHESWDKIGHIQRQFRLYGNSCCLQSVCFSSRNILTVDKFWQILKKALGAFTTTTPTGRWRPLFTIQEKLLIARPTTTAGKTTRRYRRKCRNENI